MAKSRRLERVTFVRPRRRATGNLRPPFSKALRRVLAQNAEAVARVICFNFVLTKGLPAAALAPLQTSVERFFRDDLSPRIDEIDADDAELLSGKAWSEMSRDVSARVANTPDAEVQWFLSVGMDVDGETAFKVWPIVISELFDLIWTPEEVMRREIELMILERFAVILNKSGRPEPWVKLW